MRSKGYLWVLGTAVVCCLMGCATGIQNDSYANYPDRPYICRFRINSVKVTVDHVNEKGIAEQLYVIAETYLEAGQGGNGETKEELTVDIRLTQRSFMYGIELYNTIYITADARDKSGVILARESKFISGKRSIISATEQNGILRDVLGRMIKEQQRHNKKTLKRK